MNADPDPEEEPSDLETPPAEPDDLSDLDYADIPCTDDGSDLSDGDPSDDRRWDAFIPDEDQRDPAPEPGDFWIENGDESDHAQARAGVNALYGDWPDVGFPSSLLL
jgi:hypothetical protein